MSKQTGGPVYPCRIPTGELHANGDPAPTRQHYGMTLRDYLAAKALQGVLASDNLQTVNFEKIADDSYRMADAMLKAREQ